MVYATKTIIHIIHIHIIHVLGKQIFEWPKKSINYTVEYSGEAAKKVFLKLWFMISVPAFPSPILLYHFVTINTQEKTSCSSTNVLFSIMEMRFRLWGELFLTKKKRNWNRMHIKTGGNSLIRKPFYGQ